MRIKRDMFSAIAPGELAARWKREYQRRNGS